MLAVDSVFGQHRQKFQKEIFCQCLLDRCPLHHKKGTDTHEMTEMRWMFIDFVLTSNHQVREAAAALLAFHKKKAQEGSQGLLLNQFSQIKLIISLWEITGAKAKTFQM